MARQKRIIRVKLFRRWFIIYNCIKFRLILSKSPFLPSFCSLNKIYTSLMKKKRTKKLIRFYFLTARSDAGHCMESIQRDVGTALLPRCGRSNSRRSHHIT
jgi:hypothetical protein